MSHAEQILELTKQIKPLLAGKPAVVQSGALADLIAMWLAGHWIPGCPDETEQIRRDLFERYCELVIDLVEVNARELGTDV